MFHEFWFRPKLKGYGAVPITWEGYTLIVFLFIVVFGCAFVMTRQKYSSIFPPPMRVVAITTIIVVMISAWKTNGPWG